MGLYRERTGATVFVSATPASAEALRTQAQVAARRIYSMPPAHGALLAARVLQDAALNDNWRDELQAMCRRINGLRTSLVSKLELCTERDFSFIEREKGMFSFLGLSPAQALALREQYSVYMLDSSRINIAGINGANIDYLAESVGKVLQSA